MEINKTTAMKLELWVKDSGNFDGFAVYFDGDKIANVVDQGTHVYTLPDKGTLSVVVQFGGNDGGISAVVDNKDPNNQTCLGKQDGKRHAYIFKEGI